MTDIFNNTILCEKCDQKMEKIGINKNGFLIRAVVCPKCNSRILHPADEQEHNKFINLRNRDFRVKMRLVGNSYAVSIPKEIVSFMREQENMMNNMVKLSFEDLGRVSLNFDSGERKEGNARVIRAREYKIVKNNKPVLHVKQFSDSADPRNNKTLVRREEDSE